ncbi:MAG TPA: serine/threonine-protein kinase [Nannocystaceae bacterium]|nr:serine/threonine-protein kinase [Nannocystaceae bacterium]
MRPTAEPDRARTDGAAAADPQVGGHDATLAGERSDERPSRDASPLARDRIGRYRVVGTLGRGGMGRVYEAVDDRLDRGVAVKILHEHLSDGHRRRLVREAQALARLSHPNVVHVYEIEEADGETFIAMELVRGQTLEEWARRDPSPSWRVCVEVYRQAGAGLAAAHSEGLVHRDFKPSNAIIDAKGRVRVLDFGIVRQADEREPTAAEDAPFVAGPDTVIEGGGLTTTGTLLGTPAYMAPEQMSRHDVDARGDQFSFCVSLYEALYGERPFAGDTIAQLMFAVTSGHVRPAPTGSAVPSQLRRVLLRGLAVEPEQRWPTMEALLKALEGGRTRTMVWLAGGVAAALAVGFVARGMTDAPAPTVAEAETDLRAELLYEEGMLALVQGRLDEAVEKWSSCYELSGRVLVLYNLSTALVRRYEQSREMDDLLRARAAMTTYLESARRDPGLDAQDAERRITELDAMIADAGRH